MQCGTASTSGVWHYKRHCGTARGSLALLVAIWHGEEERMRRSARKMEWLMRAEREMANG